MNAQTIHAGPHSLRLAPLAPEQLSHLLALEQAVLYALSNPALLRRNTPQMWRCCLLPPHAAFGVWDGHLLVAAAVLYRPAEGDGDDLSRCLVGLAPLPAPSANYKICLVLPAYRGLGLQRTLGRCLEDEARRQGVALLCATASPLNAPSVANLLRLGYRFHSTIQKYGRPRNLYYKTLTPSTQTP